MSITVTQQHYAPSAGQRTASGFIFHRQGLIAPHRGGPNFSRRFVQTSRGGYMRGGAIESIYQEERAKREVPISKLTANKDMELAVQLEHAESRRGAYGRKFELQFFDTTQRQWKTVLTSGSSKARPEDLGLVRAQQHLQFRIIDHGLKVLSRLNIGSDGQQTTSLESHRAKVQQHADGSITVAFEAAGVRGQILPQHQNYDYRDFVFTIYEKETGRQIGITSSRGENHAAGQGNDQVTVTGEQTDSNIELRRGHDRAELQNVVSNGSKILGQHGNDTILGAGTFDNSAIEGGDGSDTIEIDGTFRHTTVRGESTPKPRPRAHFPFAPLSPFSPFTPRPEPDLRGQQSGHDKIQLRGEFQDVTVSGDDGNDQLLVGGLSNRLHISGGSGNDLVGIDGITENSHIDLGDGDDQALISGITRGLYVDLGYGNDALVISKDWVGELTIRDPKRARQKKSSVNDYDQLLLEGPGWRRVNKRTYEKVDNTGEVVGRLHIDGKRKRVEVIRDTEGTTFQNKKPKRGGLFGTIANIVIGIVSIVNPAIGAIAFAIKTAIDVASGKIKGFGNVLLSVGRAALNFVSGGAAQIASKVLNGVANLKSFIERPSIDGALGLISSGFSFAKAGVANVANKVIAGVRSVKNFITKPSVEGGLGLASLGASFANQPIVARVLSGVRGVYQAATGKLEGLLDLAFSIRDILRIDSARRREKQAREAANEGTSLHRDAVSLLRAIGTRQQAGAEIKSIDDPSIRPGDLVEIDGGVGVVQQNGWIARLDSRGKVAYDTRLLALSGSTADPNTPPVLSDLGGASLFSDPVSSDELVARGDGDGEPRRLVLTLRQHGSRYNTSFLRWERLSEADRSELMRRVGVGRVSFGTFANALDTLQRFKGHNNQTMLALLGEALYGNALDFFTPESVRFNKQDLRNVTTSYVTDGRGRRRVSSVTTRNGVSQSQAQLALNTILLTAVTKRDSEGNPYLPALTVDPPAGFDPSLFDGPTGEFGFDHILAGAMGHPRWVPDPGVSEGIRLISGRVGGARPGRQGGFRVQLTGQQANTWAGDLAAVVSKMGVENVFDTGRGENDFDVDAVLRQELPATDLSSDIIGSQFSVDPKRHNLGQALTEHLNPNGAAIRNRFARYAQSVGLSFDGDGRITNRARFIEDWSPTIATLAFGFVAGGGPSRELLIPDVPFDNASAQRTRHYDRVLRLAADRAPAVLDYWLNYVEQGLLQELP